VSWRIVNPEGLDPPQGFSHGLAASPGGTLLFIAGQAPTDASGKVIRGGFVAQFAQCLRKIVRVVEEAGGTAQDLGRLTIFLTDVERYRTSKGELGEMYREIMGRHFPAMTLVEVAALLDKDALVEIEATAVLSGKE
jgi:enamine deaminase RidA (YjgF/YER057c/UK114 family)